MTYKEFNEKVIGFEIYRKKRISVEKISNTLGAFLTAIVFFTLCYGLTIEFLKEHSTTYNSNLPIFPSLWQFITDKSTILSFLPQLPATIVFGLVLTLLIPLLATGIYALVIYNLPAKIESEEEDATVKGFEKLSKRLNETESFYFIPDFIGRILNIFFLIMSALSCYYIVLPINPSKEIGNIVATVFLTVIMTLFYFIPYICFKKLNIAISSFMWKNRKKSESEKLKKELNAEIYNLKKVQEQKNKEKKEKEKIRQEKQKAEKLLKDLIDGENLYKEALASDPINEKKLKKAAELGYPRACYHLGKNLIADLDSDMYTSDEKEEIAERAANYFNVARQNSELAEEDLETECKFLWMFSRLQYESNNKEKWQQMLTDFRNIQKSGELPEEYTETLESAIKTVVTVIDELINQPKPQPQPTYQPTPKKKYYCIFRNGAVCTKETNSVMTYYCNYVHNPTACITARQNNAIEYR